METTLAISFICLFSKKMIFGMNILIMINLLKISQCLSTK